MEEEGNEVEEDDVEEENRSQNWEALFVRACASEVHFAWMAADTSGNIVSCGLEVEMHMDRAKEQFCMDFFRNNCRGHLRGQRFVRACAGDVRTDISQDPCCRNAHKYFTRASLCDFFCGKMPNVSHTILFEHQALTRTVRSPQCGHSVWGKTMFYFGLRTLLPRSNQCCFCHET